MKIDHIAIAVKDLKKALTRYEKFFPGAKAEMHSYEGLNIGVLPLGGVFLEFLCPVDPDHTVQKFLDKRGEGFHHIAIRVNDIEAELERWRREGAEVIDAIPRRGLFGHRVAFIHPRSALGVLIELVEDREAKGS